MKPVGFYIAQKIRLEVRNQIVLKVYNATVTNKVVFEFWKIIKRNEVSSAIESGII